MTTNPVSVTADRDRPRTSTSPTGRRGAFARLFLGEREDAPWLRPAFWALLVVTAVVYLVDLTSSGYANSFYAAAVQAGTKSWKALFFGSLDSENFITVDKPPAALWVMGLSARLFGFSSFSMLLPEALMAVASVALVWGTVRRTLARLGTTTANVGALLAGFIVAFTPAAALMFRFNNPDALLVMLMSAGAYCTVRALRRGSWRWLALVGIALGFAFLTKMLQGLLVLPAFAIVYLLAARTTWGKRIIGLLIAAGTLVVSAGWWVLVVALWPASSRPYIGGSTNNTVLELVFGYNGLGRVFGGSGNGGGGMGGTAGSSFGGSTGLNRLFSSEMGLEISWLLPAALLALALGLVIVGRRSISDPVRSGLLLWGGWLVVTGLVFSFMSGTIHPYYTVALVPAIAGLVGTGGALLWSARDRAIGRLGLAGTIAITAYWGWCLLNENPTWLPWLRWVILIGGILSAIVIVVGSVPSLRKFVAAGVLAGTLFGLTGTTAYAIATTTVGHTGSIPSAGPASTTSGGMGSGGMGGGMGSQSGSGSAPGGSGSGSFPGGTGGAPGGSKGSSKTGTMPQFPGNSSGTKSGSKSGSASSGGSGMSMSGAGMGDGASSTSSALKKLLKSSNAKWAAAVNNSESAAQLELDTNTAVMAIGGWSSDPTPTLAEFKAYVKAGKIGYYVASSSMGGGAPTGASGDASGSDSSTTGTPPGGNSSGDAPEGGSGGMAGGGGGTSSYATAIEKWVKAHYTAKTVGGQTVYDLSDPK